MTLPLAAPAMQRSHGTGALAVKTSAGATRIDRLHQSGNAKIRVPKTYGAALEAVLINTSGGITGGDTLDWTLHAGSGTQAVVTTQACERIYKSSLFWLPQETILFDGGRLHRELQVDLARDARFIGLESLVFGREAMGETVARGFFHDRWRIRRDGRLVHADDLRFDLSTPGDIVDPAILGPNRVVATLVALLPEDAESLDLAVAACRTRLAGTAGGVSRIGSGADAKIVVRLAAPSSYVLRRHLLPVIALFLGERSMPKVWSL